jgi:hypothetical protein
MLGCTLHAKCRERDCYLKDVDGEQERAGKMRMYTISASQGSAGTHAWRAITQPKSLQSAAQWKASGLPAFLHLMQGPPGLLPSSRHCFAECPTAPRFDVKQLRQYLPLTCSIAFATAGSSDLDRMSMCWWTALLDWDFAIARRLSSVLCIVTVVPR